MCDDGNAAYRENFRDMAPSEPVTVGPRDRPPRGADNGQSKAGNQAEDLLEVQAGPQH